MSKQTITILVGSKNPVKVNAVKGALSPLFPKADVECIGMHAPSGVPDQPMNSDETRIGAVNRVEYCKSQQRADFYVAMEGGVDRFDYGAFTFAYVVIDNGQQQSVGRSAILPIPDSVYAALESGIELGTVMDELFGTTNVKQKGGAIGLLTNGQETRESAYTQALTLAMAPFLHPERY